MQIIEGTHQGKQGKIIKVEKRHLDEDDPNAYLTIELTSSGAILSIKRKRIMLEHLYKQLFGSKTKVPEQFEKKREAKSESKKPLKWVTQGLVVRVISDKVMDGKMYNKKVQIKNIMNQF